MTVTKRVAQLALDSGVGAMKMKD
jgi:ATP-dependent DNA ligase